MYREYAVKLWNMASPDASIAVIQHSSFLLSFHPEAWRTKTR